MEVSGKPRLEGLVYCALFGGQGFKKMPVEAEKEKFLKDSC